jgi:hypothetical protein
VGLAASGDRTWSEEGAWVVSDLYSGLEGGGQVGTAVPVAGGVAAMVLPPAAAPMTGAPREAGLEQIPDLPRA